MPIAFNNQEAFTHVYRATSGGTAFSSNLAASSAFDYFNDTPAVNDALYLGCSTTTPRVAFSFKDIRFYVGTAMVGVYTLVYEYWNGSTWATLTVTDNTVNFTITGQNDVTYTVPTNWIQNTINSVSARWVRVRLSAITTVTEGGAQSTQVATSGTFAVHVTGYSSATPATFTDIYNADVAGAWGVVTKQGSQFRLSCSLILGDGSTASYLTTKQEAIEILGGAYTTVNGYFTSGSLIDLATRRTEKGSFISFKSVYANAFYQWFVTSGINYFYSTILDATSYTYGARFINTLRNGTMLPVPTTDSPILSRTTTAQSSQGIDTQPATFEDILIYGATTQALRTPGNAVGSDTTITNFKGRNNTRLWAPSAATGGSRNIFFVNADTDTWVLAWVSGYTGKVYERYTANVTVLDRDNNPIVGALVALYNVNGTVQFSVSTDSNGVIAKQTVTAKDYARLTDTTTTTTDYNDFRLVITKTGYETIDETFTLNQKLTWNTVLKARRRAA